MPRPTVKSVPSSPLLPPLIMGVYPLLFFYSRNRAQLLQGTVDLVFLLIIGALTSLALYLLLKGVWRSTYKASLFSFFLLLIFYSYGHLYNFHAGMSRLLEGWFGGSSGIVRLIEEAGWERLQLGGLALLILLVLYGLGKLKREAVESMITPTSIVGGALLLSTLFSLVHGSRAANLSEGLAEPPDEEVASDSAIIKRDIYHIVLDSYARNDVLLSLFEYDNSEFTDFLENKGFYVASLGTSNYVHTFLSLPSTLHMDYVNYLSDELGEASKNNALPLEMIEENPVTAELKANGYRFINASSGWMQTTQNSQADLNVNNGFPIEVGPFKLDLDEFKIVFLQTTALRPVIEPLVARSIRTQVLHTFSELKKVPNIKEPTYVFAHFFPPHPPFLFDRDGNPVEDAELSLIGAVYEDRDQYLDQLIYMNQGVSELIDTVLKESEVEPIIILQSDHGPATTLGHPLKWPRPPEKNLPGVKERMSILSAYYLPEVNADEVLSPDISPVNSYRIIFNEYFGADHHLLETKNYYSDYQKYYEFFDVTEEIHSVNLAQ